MTTNLLSSRWIDRSAVAVVVILGFAIPVSAALSGILLAAFAVLFALSGHYRDRLRAVPANPVAVAALLLFLWMLMAVSYGTATWTEASLYIGKYRDLVFLALFLPYFTAPELRRKASIAICGAMAITLVLSFLGAAGLVTGRPENSALVFKGQITQNLFLAYFGFALLVVADATKVWSWRLTLRIVAILAIANVVYFGMGRTGYMAVGLLLFLYLWQKLRLRGVLIFAALAMLTGVTNTSDSGSPNQRIALAVEEIKQWESGKSDPNSSMGIRMDFYRNSLAIIGEHPLLGVGTGGMINAYSERIRNTENLFTRNPHNEYLLIAVQQGMIGLGLLLALFVVQWRMANQLVLQQESMLARGLVLVMAAGCLFNSLLLDHTEGLAYAWMSALLFSGPRRESGGIP